MPSRMSVAELLALPPAIDLPTAGRAWGFGRTKAHELARAGDFPCPVLRVGHAYRVTRADLLRSLGIQPETRAALAPDMPVAGPADPATANDPPRLEDVRRGQRTPAA